MSTEKMHKSLLMTRLRCAPNANFMIKVKVRVLLNEKLNIMSRITLDGARLTKPHFTKIALRKTVSLRYAIATNQTKAETDGYKSRLCTQRGNVKEIWQQSLRTERMSLCSQRIVECPNAVES